MDKENKLLFVLLVTSLLWVTGPVMAAIVDNGIAQENLAAKDSPAADKNEAETGSTDECD